MLFVEGSHQRRGIARGLIRATAIRASRDGQPALGFTVNSSLSAIGAYEQLGFVAVGPEQEVRGIRFVPMEQQAPASL